MTPAAIGVDLVDVASFGEQLRQEGSVFHRVFTAREWNAALRFAPEQGASSAGQSPSGPLQESASHLLPESSVPELPTRALHSLAARWAAKEAFIKAWSSLYYGREDPLKSADIDWAQIEVVCDRWGRPAFRFHGRIASELDKTQEELKASLSWLLSLSHDGNYAIAWVSVNQTDLREAKEFS